VMDLLGGYGSSDGDSDGSSASVQSATGPAPPPPPPAAATTAAGGGGISKKGRRLLSLGAVLPPEIFDRLVRDEQGGSSSDSEQSAGSYSNHGAGGDNGGTSSTSKKKKRAPKRKTAGSTGVGLGGGSAVPPPGEMGDLLRELRSAPSVGPAGGEQGQNATKKKPPPPPREEKLGMAFMTVTTTVASKKDVGVENIHTSRSVAGLAAAPSAEAAESTRGDDMNRKKPAFAAATRRAAAPGVAVPRPGLSAAPSVRTGAAYAPPQQQQQQQQQQYQYQYQNNQRAQQQQYHQEPAMGAQQSRKKSRKELERSLRAGKFDALGDDARATTVHQDDLDYGGGYAPTEADLSEAAARTAAANAAKSGAAGLRMYDPSAGGDVDVGAEVSQKHRSKHQINQLVAKAAVLEAHRAGGVGPSGQRSVKGSNSRADAKRKYGW